MKQWKVKEPVSENIKKQFPELPLVVLQLLWNRNLRSQKEIDEFLNPDWGEDVHDPHLFKEMKKAVERLLSAIENGEKITIHGDYDADGVGGTVILYETLSALSARVDFYLPHRETEGYGLNSNTINYLKEKETKLIITCDCGISNAESIRMAKEKGIDVIITDHHAIPLELPKAFAILHPQVEGETYPFKFLAGGGVAFKLAQALLRTDLAKEKIPNPSGFEKWFLDMVAVSSVADMVPLVGENRALTSYGLVVMNKTRRIGLEKLIKSARSKGKITTETISFQIAPRINAAGRIDHANTAIALLLEKNGKRALELAENLERTNKDRQKMTEVVMGEALKKIGEVKDDPILIAKEDDWPLGVAGLVAGRISDQTFKPVIIMTYSQDRLTGSGRSIPAFNMIQALQKLDKYLFKYGGHPQACGFSLKNNEDFEDFVRDLKKIARKKLAEKDFIPTLEADARISLSEITWDLWDLLQKFEPFGIGNPRPLYLLEEVEISGIETVGQDGKHLRLTLSDGKETKKAIAFGFGKLLDSLSIGSRIDVIIEISLNEWNGNRELQLSVADIRMP